MKYEQLNKKGWIIALVFIILSGLIIQWRYMDEFPSYIHAWSQADRYALALGFVNNDLDLLHPETFIYNKQFPHKWNHPYDNTITSVDFPILEYFVAIVMKITGLTSPFIFRICSLLVAFIGMFFLYKLTFLITKDWIKSILLVAIAMTSPVYAYYFNGFIPSIPAFTFMLIAYYCYFKYLTNNEVKEFNVAILFCTLSMLTRSSFAVAYIAILCFEFLRILKKESSFINKIIPISISFVLFLSYYFWNRHLANENGTLFLGDLMLADNWEDFVYCITKAKDNWKLHYFTNRHYWIFALFIVSALLCGVFNFIKKKKENVVEENNVGLSLWWICAILFFGNICFLVAMVRQFPNHDYYFIDTFFLPILLLMILTLNVLPKIVNFKQVVFPMALLLFFIVFMIKDVNEMQVKRRAWWWGKDSERTINNYQGSEQFLDSLNITRDAKILALFAYPQNTPFILMNRKGFTEMHDREENVKIKLDFDYDYLVIENELYKENSEILTSLQYIADNGKIMIFSKK